MLIARVNYPNVPQMGISVRKDKRKTTRENIPETALLLLCHYANKKPVGIKFPLLNYQSFVLTVFSLGHLPASLPVALGQIRPNQGPSKPRISHFCYC